MTCGTKLAHINAELDVALDRRVRLHQDAKAGRLAIPDYLTGLREIRDIEARLEPERRRLGATHTRAFELCQQEAA